MRIFGVDFTSRPSRRKPICVARCWLDEGRLRFEALEQFADFAGFEAFLRRPGPWVAGFDFPFGQSEIFLANTGWNTGDWAGYIRRVAALDRADWRKFLETYKADRAAGDREHSRSFERGSGAASPQKLYGVPVALMFYEGAPRLLASGADIPGLVKGDPARVAVEAYPGVLARFFTRDSYKSEALRDATPARLAARLEILRGLSSDLFQARYRLEVSAPEDLAMDAKGDALDAMLCAVQAAWAYGRLGEEAGFLRSSHRAEGWIADPSCFGAGRDV